MIISQICPQSLFELHDGGAKLPQLGGALLVPRQSAQLRLAAVVVVTSDRRGQPLPSPCVAEPPYLQSPGQARGRSRGWSWPPARGPASPPSPGGPPAWSGTQAAALDS